MPDPLVLTSLNGQPGELMQVQTDTPGPQPVLVQAFAATLSAWGTQAAWAIDPATGNDRAAGTPAAPLATMAEFNLRMQGQLVQQATTLQLVGNVVDAPLWLNGTRFVSTLTVSGTRTTVLAGIPISLVTGLGPAGTRPWQLTTTGIDWTLQSLDAIQIRFNGGQVAAPMAVIDANNVIVGALYAAGTAVADVTPTTAMTITVATLSRALPPLCNCSGLVASSTAPIVQINDLDFNPANAHLMSVDAGCQLQFFGCSFESLASAWVVTAQGFLNFRACGFNTAGNQVTFRLGTSSNSGSTGLVARGTGATAISHQAGITQHNNLSLQGSKLAVIGGGVCNLVTCFIRGATNPVQVQQGGKLNSLGTLTGSGNAGIGVDVTAGLFTYLGAANKPTVTGASDCRVGGTARTYAQIPFVALVLASVPPLVVELVGDLAAFVQES